MSNTLSVVIFTKKEEKYIAEAIKSAQFAHETLILDSNSDDGTIDIAKRLGARVIKHEWLGFGPQKNAAINLASNDWVFVLDSDERITLKLQNEILSILKNPNHNGYQVPRLNWFFGKAIKTCGLYPDYSVRLFNKNYGHFTNVPVHESVKIIGKASKLKNHMIHLAYKDVDEFTSKQKNYAKLSQKKKNIFKSIISPCWIFFRLYFIKLGFIDGWRGFEIAKGYAKYTFWKYSK